MRPLFPSCRGREGGEVYTVELYKKVRLACSGGMSARAAARHFNLLHGTVDKMMAFSVPPGYRRDKPIRRPKLDGFTEFIDAWLEADKAVHRKQRHTAKRIAPLGDLRDCSTLELVAEIAFTHLGLFAAKLGKTPSTAPEAIQIWECGQNSYEHN